MYLNDRNVHGLGQQLSANAQTCPRLERTVSKCVLYTDTEHLRTPIPPPCGDTNGLLGESQGFQLGGISQPTGCPWEVPWSCSRKLWRGSLDCHGCLGTQALSSVDLQSPETRAKLQAFSSFQTQRKGTMGPPSANRTTLACGETLVLWFLTLVSETCLTPIHCCPSRHPPHPPA